MSEVFISSFQCQIQVPVLPRECIFSCQPSAYFTMRGSSFAEKNNYSFLDVLITPRCIYFYKVREVGRGSARRHNGRGRVHILAFQDMEINMIV